MSGEMLEVSVSRSNSQRCEVPLWLFKRLNVSVGSYVIIECSPDLSVLNQVFPTTHSENIVIAGGIVSRKRQSIDQSATCLSFYVPATSFLSTCLVDVHRLKLEAVMVDFATVADWALYENEQSNVVRQLVYDWVVMNGFTINLDALTTLCSKIVSINIVDTYGGIDAAGRVAWNTELEITPTSLPQLQQRSVFQHLRLGAMDHYLMTMDKFFRKRCKDKQGIERSGFLITGPSGCGKTTFVQKFSHIADSYLITISAADVRQMSEHDIESLLKTFEKGAKLRDVMPCVVFFEDLDNVSAKDDQGNTMCGMLRILDGVLCYRNIPAFATAKSVDLVHPDFKKHSRFSRNLRIGVPNCKQRKQILECLMRGVSHGANLDDVAQCTQGYVGSDLSLLCKEAEQISQNKHLADSILTSTFKEALNAVKPSILKNSKFLANVAAKPWSDIIGMEEIKKQLRVYVEWPIVNPQRLSAYGIRCPRGVLLFGPPGCCKTTLVRALATACNATFLSATPSQIFSPYFGDSEKLIVQLFLEAATCAPSIIFLDEIDSLVGQRSCESRASGVAEKVLTALLVAMDGFGAQTRSLRGIEGASGDMDPAGDENSSSNVMVVAATNRIDLLDNALIRPGRFDMVLYVPPPDKKERLTMFEKLAESAGVTDMDWNWLAECTPRFSGADVRNLYRTAAVISLKSNSTLSKEHFEMALELVHPSLTESQLKEYGDLAAKYAPIA